MACSSSSSIGELSTEVMFLVEETYHLFMLSKYFASIEKRFPKITSFSRCDEKSFNSLTMFNLC